MEAGTRGQHGPYKLRNCVEIATRARYFHHELPEGTANHVFQEVVVWEVDVWLVVDLLVVDKESHSKH